MYLSRQNIFQVFVNYYYKNEIKRLAHDQTFKELLNELFGFKYEKDFY